MLQEHFAKQVRERRRALNITQADLGAVLRCSAVTVMNMEKAKSMPGADTFLAVCQALSLDPRAFIGHAPPIEARLNARQERLKSAQADLDARFDELRKEGKL